MQDKEAILPIQAFFLNFKAKFDDKNLLKSPDENLSFKDFWNHLAASYNVDGTKIAEMVAELSGDQNTDKDDLKNPDPSLVAKVPYNLANSMLFLPLRKEGNTVILAISNPFDETMHEMIRFIFGMNTRCLISSPDTLYVAIASAYENISGTDIKHELTLDPKEADSNTDRQIPKLARQLLTKALEKGASDLHLQDFVGGSAVRIRVDGLLQRLLILPNSVANNLIRYFKSLGGMDPTLILRPQDGRVSLKLADQEYDLRISIIPTQGAKEKLVVRFLNRNSVFNLSSKSFSLEEIHTIRRLASSPSGVILVCGPTGSGKTTTLYSILSELNTEQVSISTVENPVEYNMPGFAQTEVNEKAGVTFASSLKTILRQDPDIILIGEIRDPETAKIAMQSALTGHLVFSTLHTNDALSSISRLKDLGIETSILSEALAGVISQRLVRKLCSDCKELIGTDLTPIEEGFLKAAKVKPGYRAVGCESCNFSGYSGRMVITEMFEIDSQLRSLILSGETDIKKLSQALGDHKQNLSVSASRLIISGETSVEEVVRVIGRHFWIDVSEEYKTELPSLSVLSNTGEQLKANAKIPILLVGPQESFTETFKASLNHAWISILTASSPEESKKALKDNEEIKFVIVDVDESLDDEDILKYVSDYRVAMAWSRLPALIRLPEGREDLKEKLQADGATSRFVLKSEPSEQIIEMINSALAENLDYSWGIEN